MTKTVAIYMLPHLLSGLVDAGGVPGVTCSHSWEDPVALSYPGGDRRLFDGYSRSRSWGGRV